MTHNNYKSCWINYLVGAPAVSEHVYTQYRWQNKTKGLPKSSSDASQAEHLACFGSTFYLGMQSLLSVSKSCICMWSPDGLHCETSTGWSSILLHIKQTSILPLPQNGITSSTSYSVTWALVLTACVLGGTLLGKTRKVIAGGMWRLNVQISM